MPICPRCNRDHEDDVVDIQAAVDLATTITARRRSAGDLPKSRVALLALMILAKALADDCFKNGEFETEGWGSEIPTESNEAILDALVITEFVVERLTKTTSALTQTPAVRRCH